MCPVCGGETRYWTDKNFPDGDKWRRVEYRMCSSCGFTYSPTIWNMPDEEFEKINWEFHRYLAGESVDHDPNWMARTEAQVQALVNLKNEGRIPTDKPWLDYACGNGLLVEKLNAAGICTVGYEKYMRDVVRPSVELADELQIGAYDCVITTSFLEHVRSVGAVDFLSHLVSKGGSLVTHTMVEDSYSFNSTWFYLLSTHCTFWTHKSMAITRERLGFRLNTYIPGADIHVWVR